VAQHPLDVKFEGGIRLAGYDLAKQVVKPGEVVSVVLYWETNVAPLTVNLQPFVHLDRLNEWTTIADATNYTPGDVTTESNLPTFHWDTARYVRDEHDLIIPPTAEPQVYAVRAGLVDPDQTGALWPLAGGSGDTVHLALINVAPTAEPAPLAHPLQVPFAGPADTIDLAGFEITAQDTARLEFSLAWRSRQTPQRDYTVFAQLLDMNQNLVASFDQPPRNGTYPTDTWLAGQTVIDPRFVPLTGIAPGPYQLIVGLYDSATQKRLVTPQGADFITLTTVTIE
ncbi:MAG: hypothetical protein R3264_17780, partial [Anaerolineae bacterium]|nr:hypothetical protein [Anaerolineae bacterium]